MVEIRNAKTADMKEIHYILNNSRELRGYIGGEAYSINWVNEVIEDRKRNIFLIAEESKEMAGFLIANILPCNDIFLNDLYVKPKYRKQGIAGKLLDRLEILSKKIKSRFSMALILVGNKKMQNLMKKYDYKMGEKLYYYYKLK